VHDLEHVQGVPNTPGSRASFARQPEIDIEWRNAFSAANQAGESEGFTTYGKMFP
jgi:hypothetical protein